MNQFEQAAPYNPPPLGLGLIGLVLIGSLWGCIGFIGEWAGIAAGLPEEFAHRLFRGLAFATTGLACGLSVWALRKIPSWRKQAAIGISLYLLLVWLTPRSFTYDTGLYHLPLINHLSQIGLEWNLGWLHSRYAFFNLLLYGQSALSRLAGTVALPSLNGLVLTGTLLFLGETIDNKRSLAASVIIAGALLLPSESTESFHSFNADFSLGCIFLVCCILIGNKHLHNQQLSLIATGLTSFLPLIKLSGLFLVPVVLTGYLKRWHWQRLGHDTKALFPLIVLLALTTFGFGYITTGYLSYPVVKTGPLRAESISRSATIKESRFNTTGWARFAYSGQIDAIKADASLSEWFPKWSESLNGKRMLTYTMITLASACIGWATTKQRVWTLFLTANTGLWILAILVLPPDPRFYLGPILLTLYGSAQTNNFLNGKSWETKPARAKVFYAAALTISLFTSIWRSSEHERSHFPQAYPNGQIEIKGFYHPRKKRMINLALEGKCWTIPPPCGN